MTRHKKKPQRQTPWAKYSLWVNVGRLIMAVLPPCPWD